MGILYCNLLVIGGGGVGRWLCQNFGHLYLLQCEGNFHGIRWRHGKCTSTQPTFFPRQFSLPRRLWLGGNDRMPGWPWLLWQTTCRLRWGALLKQPFLCSIHHVDVDRNSHRLVEVLLHIEHYVNSVNGVPTSTVFLEIYHHFEGLHLGVKRLRVF